MNNHSAIILRLRQHFYSSNTAALVCRSNPTMEAIATTMGSLEETQIKVWRYPESKRHPFLQSDFAEQIVREDCLKLIITHSPYVLNEVGLQDSFALLKLESTEVVMGCFADLKLTSKTKKMPVGRLWEMMGEDWVNFSALRMDDGDA